MTFDSFNKFGKLKYMYLHPLGPFCPLPKRTAAHSRPQHGAVVVLGLRRAIRDAAAADRAIRDATAQLAGMCDLRRALRRRRRPSHPRRRRTARAACATCTERCDAVAGRAIRDAAAQLAGMCDPRRARPTPASWCSPACATLRLAQSTPGASLLVLAGMCLVYGLVHRRLAAEIPFRPTHHRGGTCKLIG